MASQLVRQVFAWHITSYICPPYLQIYLPLFLYAHCFFFIAFMFTHTPVLLAHPACPPVITVTTMWAQPLDAPASLPPILMAMTTCGTCGCNSNVSTFFCSFSVCSLFFFHCLDVHSYACPAHPPRLPTCHHSDNDVGPTT